MNDRLMKKFRINKTNLLHKNFRLEVILMQITKIQIRLVVHRIINRNIIDQSARLRLSIVRMRVMMMIVHINDQNIRNEGRLRVNVIVVIRRTRNQVDRVSTLTMIRNGIDQFHETEVVEVLRIQILNTNRDHVLIREIGDRIIVTSLK